MGGIYYGGDNYHMGLGSMQAMLGSKPYLNQQAQQQYTQWVSNEYTMCPPTPQPPTSKRRNTMMENIKGYVEKHKDMLFTLALVILVDHFLFKGKLRERIQSTIEGALKKVEDTFHKQEA